MPSANAAKRTRSAFWKEPSCAERGPLCSSRPNMGSGKLLTETLASETLWGKGLQEATCTKRGTVPLLHGNPAVYAQSGGKGGPRAARHSAFSSHRPWAEAQGGRETGRAEDGAIQRPEPGGYRQSPAQAPRCP